MGTGVRRWHLQLAAFAAVAALLAVGAVADHPANVPAYLLNPAVSQATVDQTICKAGYTATIRPPVAYTNALKARQLPAGAKLADYEEDHWIPLEIGGSPRDPRNLWPQIWTDARRKDSQENQLHRMVCAHTMTLAIAQRRMFEGWRH